MTIASKVIAVSTDNVTYYPLPGSTGTFSTTAGELDDTIFGQNFKSIQSGLEDWKITANAFAKGFAGYVATIKASGVSTAFTKEATTMINPHQWQITSVNKRVFDPAIEVRVWDTGAGGTGAYIPDSDIASIDYLFGIVHLLSGYTVLGVIELTGNYFPMTAIAQAKEYTLNMQAAALDMTTLAIAQTDNAIREFEYGLQTVTIDTKGFYALSSGFRTVLEARNPVVIEISPDGSVGDTAVARGYFHLDNIGRGGNVGAIETEDLKFALYVPQESVDGVTVVPFEFNFTNTSPIAQAVQDVVGAWSNGTTLYVEYLPDGTNGGSGTVIVTDISLSGGVDGMGIFACSFQGSGAIATVGTPGF